MHVFIDTNILLSFYHYAKDELDSLNNVFGSHEHGSATVHLTQQVRDEFTRNREVKIKDALGKFSGNSVSPQFPSFMKGYPEYEEIRELSKKLEKRRRKILDRVTTDTANRHLIADQLIQKIFDNSELSETSDEIYQQALRRVSIGNPPGKNKSLGDAINWIILLETVPANKNIHIISGDGDFFSVLREDAPHPFLEDEWKEANGGAMCAYRSLSAFMKEHFDGIAFSYDEDKEALIDALTTTGSFAATHSLISKLEEYPYYSQKEVERILDAADENNQFGWITTDKDVASFLYRVALSHAASLTKKSHKGIWASVMAEQGDDDV